MPDDSLYAFLDRIESRPGMYLLAPTFGALVSFIDGYEMALLHHGLVEHDTPRFAGFTPWLADLVASSQNPTPYASWPAIIRRLSGGDDERAFTLFFHYLHLYRGDDPVPPPALAAALG